MAIITINNLKVDVNLRKELQYFNWERDTWHDDKLIAVSPFRHESSPSFFCNLEGEYAGTWKDSGAFTQEWEKGNFITLLSYLRNETYEETAEYLLGEYTTEYEYGAKLVLEMPELTIGETRTHLPKGWLQQYAFRHPYLGNRGISEEVQREMRIGYSQENKAVVIPWFDGNGRLANAKFRAVQGKTFWYAKNAVPIKHSVYGIDRIYKTGATTAILCEAEIDALTWKTLGYDAIALGGSTFTDVQAEIIIRSPLTGIVIARDNDSVGKSLRSKVIQKLQGLVDLADIAIPAPYKDTNEAHMKGAEIPYETTNIGLTIAL